MQWLSALFETEFVLVLVPTVVIVAKLFRKLYQLWKLRVQAIVIWQFKSHHAPIDVGFRHEI